MLWSIFGSWFRLANDNGRIGNRPRDGGVQRFARALENDRVRGTRLSLGATPENLRPGLVLARSGCPGAHGARKDNQGAYQKFTDARRNHELFDDLCFNCHLGCSPGDV